MSTRSLAASMIIIGSQAVLVNQAPSPLPTAPLSSEPSTLKQNSNPDFGSEHALDATQCWPNQTWAAGCGCIWSWETCNPDIMPPVYTPKGNQIGGCGKNNKAKWDEGTSKCLVQDSYSMRPSCPSGKYFNKDDQLCVGDDYVEIDRKCGYHYEWFRTSTYPGKCFSPCATRHPSHFVYVENSPVRCQDPADPYVAPELDDSKPVFANGIMVSGCGHEEYDSAVYSGDKSMCVRPIKWQKCPKGQMWVQSEQKCLDESQGEVQHGCAQDEKFWKAQWFAGKCFNRCVNFPDRVWNNDWGMCKHPDHNCDEKEKLVGTKCVRYMCWQREIWNGTACVLE